MRRSSTGVLALLVVGGHFSWRNRFQIRRFLEAQGIELPLDTSNVGETLRSGTAKILGKVDQSLTEVKKTEERAS
jgi:hypothetical protein